ncbi:MAG: hypothetical protein HN778_13505 [Prolixibacteraceae bacterium]|nr:hypothetical protein [Prolixibacteraceae bacterium]MBT7395843.1 hypothetical protein [Prolixibacteraceae bacterium]
MKRKKITYLLLFMWLTFVAHAQTNDRLYNLFLFTNTDYCVSGDTVWFKVILQNEVEMESNVVHVQLDSPGNNLIADVTKMSSDGKASGYIAVPDSLSTGVYFLTAFINAQRNNLNLDVNGKTLFVYNRFDENVTQFMVPGLKEKIISENLNDQIIIKTDKTTYSKGDKVAVNVEFKLPTNGTQAIINASHIDPLAEEKGGIFQFRVKQSESFIPCFNEKDGVLLSGKIVDENEVPQNGILVFLSISANPPYFDYYVTGKDGDFHFFLKDAKGKAGIFLQTVSDLGKEFSIRVDKNYFEREEKVQLENKILNQKQISFIETAINGSFINKLFNPGFYLQPQTFEMPVSFEVPFYGSAVNRVIPNEFYDLPDFQEISRELLFGVQYRVKDNEVTFRLLNESPPGFFNNEPLRLINGIPVFKNSLFTKLKSTDIDFIDVVSRERIYGDLIFKGVLAVSLNDKSNGWLAEQTNISQFSYDCLQTDRQLPLIKSNGEKLDQPDLRQVFLWENIKNGGAQNFEFNLSDLKGEVEISVEGLTPNNKFFKASKKIAVE